MARSQSEPGDRDLRELRFWFLGTWFAPEEIEVINPKAAVWCISDIPEIAYVPLVQHCLVSFHLTSSH